MPRLCRDREARGQALRDRDPSGGRRRPPRVQHLSVRALLLVLAAATTLVAGCGGDDDDQPTTPSLPTATQAPAAPARTVPEGERPAKPEPPERYERTPESLADCIRAAGGVSDVLVKGADSEDARFFGDLAGGRVDVLGVTLSGQSAEVTVVLFASAVKAGEAAPSAGGGGVVARARGAAVVVAPEAARTEAVEECLRATGYA